MTNEELIATKLLGWERFNDPDADEDSIPYKHEDYRSAYIRNGYAFQAEGGYNKDFPDFTDDRTKEYWVRRMEDALEAKGLICDYTTELDLQTDKMPWLDLLEAERPHYLGKQIGVIVGYKIRALRATAEQRVAAAVRVIQDSGL